MLYILKNDVNHVLDLPPGDRNFYQVQDPTHVTNGNVGKDPMFPIICGKNPMFPLIRGKDPMFPLIIFEGLPCSHYMGTFLVT